MNRYFLLFLIVCYSGVSQGQDAVKQHYVCIQASSVYHDKEHCASLQMCSGGKIRKVKDVSNLKPCPKCARPIYTSAGFANIKRILGVKDRKQIADSLGTPESSIKRPAGFTIRISGLPQSKTVNTLEFFFDKPFEFTDYNLLSKDFFSLLGLEFDPCKADTIRNTTLHPVTGKVSKDFSIEYRGCAIVEKRDQYEDISKYYYELKFLSKDGDRGTELDKIQLLLKSDN
ncbi:MAG: hypothetical protein ABJA70_08220 [Chryseolinea sp.]